jgi:MFS family permease
MLGFSLISLNKNLPSNQTQESWLNRNVVGMALASFLSDAGHEAATSILPLFLVSIGAPPAALGMIEGVADAVSSFVKLGAGWFSDRIGRRKPIAVFGYILTGLTTGMFALATTWFQVLLARTAGWFGRGIRGPVRDAMLSESVPAEARGRAFGFHRACDTLGAIVGPLFALAMINLLTGYKLPQVIYRQIFWLTLIPGILSAITFALFVKEHLRPANHTANLIQSIRDLPRNFKVFRVGVGVFGAGDFAHSLLTLQAIRMLTLTQGPSQAGQTAVALYVVHNVFYAGMSYPIGALADRVGKRKLLAMGYGLAAMMSLGWMIASPTVWYLGLLFALGGTFIAAEDGLEGALAGDLLPEDVRGTGYGVLASVNDLGDFLSSVIVGLLWTLTNPAVGFAYAALLSAVGAVILLRLK